MPNLRQMTSQSGGGMSRMGGMGSRSSSSKSEKADGEDPCIPLVDARTCFTLDPLTGLTFKQIPDTSFLGLGNRQSMESKAPALVYTGNLYSPHQVESFFDRKTKHDFIFANAYSLFRPDAASMIYYNTKLPITVASYSKSGGSIQANDHLKLNFAGNLNKRMGLGSMLDYVYARGTYLDSSTKPLNWRSYFYYEGDQYKAYLSYTQSKLANQENGGIQERGHVLRPDDYKRQFTDPRNMPTQLTGVWNDNKMHNIHFQHSYDMGFWEERHDTVKTDSVYEAFIPVASIFHNIDFESWKHIFRANQGADNLGGFFPDTLINKFETYDSTRYYSLSTYAGIRINEGFSRFSQFALSAFVGYEHQQYTLMQDTLNYDFIRRRHSSDNIWVGGQLSRQMSQYLTFNATARFAMPVGDKSGDVDIHGEVHATIPFGRRTEGKQRTDSLLLHATSSFQSTSPSYLLQHYFSNHFAWSNTDMSREKQLRIEGQAHYPRTGTSVRGGIAYLSDYHYFDTQGLPCVEGNDIEIYSIQVKQNLHAGQWLNWDNSVMYQHSSNPEVLPLPELSAETDISLRFRIAKTLSVQAGCAAYWHSRYYAPTYQPATQQFINQDQIKCGNYAVLNGYVNCNLKRIKFFVAMHNLLEGVLTSDTFIMPYYPLTPRRFEYGVILDLQN